MTAPLRIGLLGAARIAPAAVIVPARELDRVEVVAVAARDATRAAAFAEEHEIPLVFDSYPALVESDAVDAVYIGLPPSEHERWTLAALDAGKHVLCEKPFACTATQAESMVAAADRTGLVLAEAFHWRYHPLAARIREVLRSGTIGRIVSIDASFSAAIPDVADIRHQLALGGGAMMDLGCYAVQWARFAAENEPEGIEATAVEGETGIDLSMEATLRFAGGIDAIVRCSMAPDVTTSNALRVIGDAGTVEVINPVAPHLGHSLVVQDRSGTSTETVPGRTTYDHQLEAFVGAVLDGEPIPTGGADAIATMRVIDACYSAAGLPTRGS